MQDFDVQEDGEVLDLHAVTGMTSFADITAAATQQGADVVIDTGAGSITLLAVTLDDLTASDFLF